MKVLSGAAALETLRRQPLWMLLAADKAPLVVALLHSRFLEEERTLPNSVLHERLTRDIDQLRSAGQDMAQTPQAYVAHWLDQGWLVRRSPAGASEEEYELSADAAGAVRYLLGMFEASQHCYGEQALAGHSAIG